ncbi:hypothetical protein CH333_04960 [candidate division WOR-3 bacterium JGI_Cruoil_03_44_89]|uniref:Uncharacterized protein n=1 Tax=candidate division WOR-3 bacterium JGI_Cruoil_03_44_89 TaxID=1973748 RepID=A0A235BU49_UNCW3|nr:MAG: hypothetical protein CH333_04960 [candidate division WOR-3 bacterium JGI_Cruoil_03_44_89]
MKEDKYIPGIYNYCDRWCERCPLRRRCFLYAKEQKRIARHKARGEDPYDWKYIIQDVKENFDETLKLLHKFAEEKGIDLSALPEEKHKDYEPDDHPLMKAASDYLKMAQKFLEKLRQTIQAEGIDLAKTVEIIPSAKSNIGTLRKIAANYEVICWYHTLIPVKIHRALQSKMEINKDEFAQSDADASAKIAYIGIMKSMNALKAIYNWNEDLQDGALVLLVAIDKLRRGVDKEFPGHHTFKRPGFDD